MVQSTFRFAGRIALFPDRPHPQTRARKPTTRPPVERKPVRLSARAYVAGRRNYRVDIRWLNCRPMDGGAERTILDNRWAEGWVLLLRLNGNEWVDARHWTLTEHPDEHPDFKFSLRKARLFQQDLNAQVSVDRLLATIGDVAELADTLGSQLGSTQP